MSDPVPLQLFLAAPHPPTLGPHVQGDRPRRAVPGPRICREACGSAHPALPASPSRSSHLQSCGPGRQERASGLSLTREGSTNVPTPSPQGLPGLAGAGSLQACELTLGTELWGIWSCGQLIPKPVLLSCQSTSWRRMLWDPREVRQVEPVREL